MANASDCKAVVNALKAADLSSAGSMLIAGLPHAIHAKASDRHAFQNELLNAVKDALESRNISLEADKVATDSKVEEEHKALETITANVESAQANQQEAMDLVTSKEQVLAAAKEQLRQWEKNHAECLPLKNSAQNEQAEKEQARDQVAAIMEGIWPCLKNGGMDADSQADDVEMVRKLLQDIGAEATLIAAVPGALRNQPCQRSPFDDIVVGGVDQALIKRHQALSSEATALATSAEQIAAESIGLEAIVEEEKMEASAAQEALSLAKAGLTEAKKALKDAVGAVTKQEKLVASIEAEQSEIGTKMCELEFASEAFERLCRGEPDVAMADTEPEPAAPMAVETCATEVQMTDMADVRMAVVA